MSKRPIDSETEEKKKRHAPEISGDLNSAVNSSSNVDNENNDSNDNSSIKIKEEPHYTDDPGPSVQNDSDEEIEIISELNYVSKKHRPKLRNVKRQKKFDDDDIVCLGEFPVKIKQEVVNIDVENDSGCINLAGATNDSIRPDFIADSHGSSVNSSSKNSESIEESKEDSLCRSTTTVSKNSESDVEHNIDGHSCAIVQKEDDDLLSKVIVKKEIDVSMDVDVGNNSVENNKSNVDNVTLNGKNNVENNVDCGNESDLISKQNGGDSVDVNNIVIKKEIPEDMDIDVSNSVRESNGIKNDADTQNGESNVENNFNIMGDSDLASKQNIGDDTINYLTIKKESVEDIDEANGILMKPKLNSAGVCDTNMLNVGDNGFSCTIKKEIIEDVGSENNQTNRSKDLTDEEELCDTDPSSPVSGENCTVNEYAAEEIAWHLKMLGTEPGLPLETHLNNETVREPQASTSPALEHPVFTIDKHPDYFSLKQLFFKSKADSMDVVNCSMVLSIIMKKLNVSSADASKEEINFEKQIENTFSMYDKEEEANDVLNQKAEEASESFLEVSEPPLDRHSPIYVLPRRMSAVYETPEPVGFDPNAVRCLEGWKKDDIRKLIQPEERLNLQPLRVNQIVDNSLPKKRSYPGNECSYAVKSSPSQINLGNTPACSTNTETPSKIPRNSTISGNFSPRANPGLINDPLNPSLNSARNMGGQVRDLRELLNRKNNTH